MLQDLSLNILDIARNSVAAGASLIEIEIVEDTAQKTLCITVRDNGRGMTRAQLRKADDPLFTTRSSRKTGLGIPLLKAAAVMTGGDFDIRSTPGKGTEVRALFLAGRADMPPLGDVKRSIFALIATGEGLDVVYTRKRDEQLFTLCTRKICNEMGANISPSHPEVLVQVRKCLRDSPFEIVREEEDR